MEPQNFEEKINQTVSSLENNVAAPASPTEVPKPPRKGLTPSQLIKYMVFTALGWAVVGLLAMFVGQLVNIDMFESLAGVNLIIGIGLIALFCIAALIEAIRCFGEGRSSEGFQFLALILVLPIIGVGVGCGTCYVGIMTLDGVL